MLYRKCTETQQHKLHTSPKRKKQQTTAAASTHLIDVHAASVAIAVVAMRARAAHGHAVDRGAVAERIAAAVVGRARRVERACDAVAGVAYARKNNNK